MPAQKHKKAGRPQKTPSKKTAPKKPPAAKKTAQAAKNAAKKKPRKKAQSRWAQPAPVVVDKPKIILKHHIYESAPIDRTVRATEKAVKNVLDDHIVRCTIPSYKMAAICEKLKNKYSHRKIAEEPPFPLLEASFYDAFSQIDEYDIGMDKSMFLRELNKYLLIAISKFSCLSKVTLMSIVQDLDASEANLYEYEKGAPAKVASTVHHFYGLTEKEFENMHLHTILEMKMRYQKEKLEYHKEMDAFLNMKHKEVMAKAKELKATTKHNKLSRAARDMYFCYPEGKIIEKSLLDAWVRNHDIAKAVQLEYDRLENVFNRVVIPIKEGFRTYMLAGDIGVRKETFEQKLDDLISRTPLEVLKKASGYKRKPNLSWMNDEHPDNHIILTPSIHLVHDSI